MVRACFPVRAFAALLGWSTLVRASAADALLRVWPDAELRSNLCELANVMRTDHEHGEWFMGVSRDGRTIPPMKVSFGNAPVTTAVRAWN